MPGLLRYGKEQNMTVQKDVTKNIYVGNGSTRTFPFTFECPAEHPEYILSLIHISEPTRPY